MTAVAKKVRGDDLVRVRSITPKLAGIPDPDDVFEDKANRGWKSVLFGRMLVPFSELQEFDKDPERCIFFAPPYACTDSLTMLVGTAPW